LSVKNPEERTRSGKGRLSKLLGNTGSRSAAKKGRGRRLARPVIFVCAVVAVLVAVDYWMNAGKIYTGVEAGTIALGGKTPAEAEAFIRERTNGGLEEIRFTGPAEYTRTAEEMQIDFDVAATVDKAYSVGRRGNVLERLGDRARAAFGTITIPPEVDYQPEKARAQVEGLASRLDAEPRQGAVNIDGPEVEVAGSREGYETNVVATMQNVNRAVEGLTGEARIVGEVLEPEITTPEAEEAAQKARRAMSGPLVLAHEGEEWTIDPAQIGQALEIVAQNGQIEVSLRKGGLGQYMGGMYDALQSEPVEADFVVEGDEVSVTPSEPGKRIEDEKFFDTLSTGIFEGQRRFEVPVVTEYPELNTKEAESVKPTDLLGEYRTNYLTYDDSPGRVENLEMASEAVSGTLLAPGEVFSFNAVAEPLDYKETKVIVGGRVDEAEGGGLCQVSSTLYMAANYAGLDVIERHPHYAELPYIQPGFDATVWFGALDMKFKNTTDGYVLLREWVDENGWVNAAIYGRPNGTEVEMSSKKVSTTEDEDGNPVTEWVTYQKVTKNGEVVFDGVLHRDTYKYLKPAEEEDQEEKPRRDDRRAKPARGD
jgi:vancomycin resistance protein YoaR